MGGTPLYVDDWAIDVAYSGGQKVISAPPGASPITFNEAAWYNSNLHVQRYTRMQLKFMVAYVCKSWSTV